MFPSPLLLLCLHCNVVMAVHFSKLDFVFRGLVQKNVIGHVIKELPAQGELKFPNCSQECLREKDCTGFEFCDVSSSRTCRLVHGIPEFSEDGSGQCRHFGKYADLLYACAGFSSVITCINSIPATSGMVTGSFQDCSDCDCVASHTSVSGVYEITISGDVILVNCVMKNEYGYTVVLHRYDGSLDFNRTYTEYATGFGSPFTEMWLGNKYLNVLTSSWVSGLLIELSYSDSSVRFVDYPDVIISGESSHYRLSHISTPSGNASNILAVYEGHYFGASDLDPGSCGCPMLGYGGWWHDCCTTPCGLTMPYNNPTHPFGWNCSAEATVRLVRARVMVRRG